MQNCSNRNCIISSYFTRHSIHHTVHNLHPLTLSTIRFFNRHHWMESNKGFGYDLGLCRHHAYGNAENTNGWFQTSFHYMTTPITDPLSGRNIGKKKLSIRHKQGVMLQTFTIWITGHVTTSWDYFYFYYLF